MKKNRHKERSRSIWKKSKNTFCSVFLCKTNIKRDVAVVFSVVLISIFTIMVANYSFRISMQRRLPGVENQGYFPGNAVASEEEIYQEVKAIQETIDMSGWKDYQSKWYGFEVKYPGEGWDAPKGQAASSISKWEYRFQFRKSDAGLEKTDPYAGFDISVYSLEKINELSDTEEFPKIKNADLKDEEACDAIEGHIIETGDYAAEEIYVPPADDCHFPALFFSFTKGNYSYNLVPVLREGYEKPGDPKVGIVDNFPEFFSVASTLNPIDIVRPKPTPSPKITAPRPVSFKVVGGRLVCAKKNDKPSKSNKHKGKHLDMECCLDPDEYPNPWCYYDPKKYGKYL